jgi:hypothetical protein
MLGAKPGDLGHHFVQQQRNNSTVDKACSALVFLAEAETANHPLTLVILFERQVHAARVRDATAEAMIPDVRIEYH